MPYAQSGETRIFYRVDGPESAPALMLSNSLGTTHEMWAAQMEAFTQRFRVLRYDRRGHGQSDAPPGSYSLEDLGRDAMAVMDAAGVGRVSWCGLSMGGMTGLWLAANQPERIEKLVAASASTFMPPPELWNGRIKTAQDKGMEVLAAPTMQRWFTPDFIKAHHDKVAEIRRQFLTTTVEGFSGCAAAMRDMDLREAIRAIQCPVLAIAGSDDAGTTPADAAFIVSRVPDARGVILKASHICNVERPEEFSRAVMEFLP